jgi:pseudaminic acid synthase
MIDMKIKNKKIGLSHKPFIIAEMSGNHNNSLERAVKIVEEAAKCGADAIKLQTYTADTITIDSKNSEFNINDKQSLWYGKSLYELYDEAHTPWEWHEAIFNCAKKNGIICFSSAFDESAVDFLTNLDAPAFKIASFENNHIPLIKKVVRTKKPIIISTGMATISELEDVVNIFKDDDLRNLILLKCTSNYPASAGNSNLLTIPHMKEMFNCQVGLSDHTLGNGTSIAAVTLGATVIEKHFTLNRSEESVDSAFSMEPNELRLLVSETKAAWNSLGSIHYGPSDEEMASLVFKRSIYVKKDLKKGDKLSRQNISIIRPGLGIKPKYFEQLIGKKINCDIKTGSPLKWSLIV